MADELEKMQRALNQSYADRDRMASDLDKVRDDLERSQVCKNKRLIFCCHNCSDLQREKIDLVIKKSFFKSFKINLTEQLKCQLEQIIGVKKPTRMTRHTMSLI
jgi:recombinational DNA repair protein RecR